MVENSAPDRKGTRWPATWRSLAGESLWLSAALLRSGQREIIAEYRLPQQMAAQHVERSKGEDLAAALRVGMADLDRLAYLFVIGTELQWHTL